MDFSKNLIKDYKYWSVYIHENQGYLGRCIVWCKREDAQDLSEISREENGEFILIIQELIQANKKLFKADWFNYAFLGNDTRHLHCHFVPRYSSLREFEGVTFKDKNWGHNYKTDRNFMTSSNILELIRLKINGAID